MCYLIATKVNPLLIQFSFEHSTILGISGIYALPEEPRSFYTNDGNLNDEVLLNWSNQLQARQ